MIAVFWLSVSVGVVEALELSEFSPSAWAAKVIKG